MALYLLFLQHGFDSIKKDMDAPVGAGLRHMGKLCPLRVFWGLFRIENTVRRDVHVMYQPVESREFGNPPFQFLHEQNICYFNTHSCIIIKNFSAGLEKT